MDLIRREDAVQAVKAYLDLCCLTEAKFHKGSDDYNDEIARDILDQITPSIDIVFCKECKHKQQCRKAVEHITHEPTSVTIGYKSVEWCSYGEREGE